ncbi:MAG: hypothetical protein ABJN65_06410 [Parasphingorhabdus sp.]
MNMQLNIITKGLLFGTATLLTPIAVQAETNTGADELLSYDLAMRCGALHTFLSVVNEDDKEQEKIHDDIATGWLALAMVRDGENGDKADREFEGMVGKLIDHINGMDDDEDAMSAFLEEGTTICDALREANQTEIESIMTE